MTADAAADADPAASGAPSLPPLGLPVGSVRACMTLCVLGTVWLQILRDQPLDEPLRDTILLVLGYYFGVRGAQTGAAANALANPVNPERLRGHPLFLPKGSIRILILVGFAAVAWTLHEQGRLLGPEGPPGILVLVGTFLAGAIAKGSAARTARWLSRRILGIVGHALALGTLAVVCAYCAATALDRLDELPQYASPAFLSVVGFYLGRR